MRAIDLIFRETMTEGQFEMKSHVLVFIDEWDEFYNETVAKVAQAILEAEQIKEA